MKKFILSLLFVIGILFSMSSCVTPAYSQDVVITSDSEDVDVSLVIRYGTPYYYNGSLLYYMYDGFYYYPYLRNYRYYYYRYSRPLPPPMVVRHFEPRHHDRPHVGNHGRNPQVRSSTFGRHHQPRGHSNFGGNRGNFNRGGGGNYGNRHFGGRR